MRSFSRRTGAPDVAAETARTRQARTATEPTSTRERREETTRRVIVLQQKAETSPAFDENTAKAANDCPTKSELNEVSWRLRTTNCRDAACARRLGVADVLAAQSLRRFSRVAETALTEQHKRGSMRTLSMPQNRLSLLRMDEREGQPRKRTNSNKVQSHKHNAGNEPRSALTPSDAGERASSRQLCRTNRAALAIFSSHWFQHLGAARAHESTNSGCMTSSILHIAAQ